MPVNLQAFSSTLIFVVLLALIYLGAMSYLFHKMAGVRVAGIVIATLSFAAFIGHIAYLIVGA